MRWWGRRPRAVAADGTVAEVDSFGASITGLSHWGQLLVVSTVDGAVDTTEWGLEPGRLPLVLPRGPIAVGGWVRMYADPAALGLDPSEVAYVVDEGDEFGVVSAGVEPPDRDGRIPVMVLAGPRPGEYHLSAVAASSGNSWRVVASGSSPAGPTTGSGHPSSSRAPPRS